ncbi:lanthionine synthetase LanC family protein [Kitasatospora sp. NPDC056651]|uniref:serine/threonine protein kinase n=1 Tax=Kitasatospora sp. NPDC056651 TaxID=3345892 RepID=UPI003673E27C
MPLVVTEDLSVVPARDLSAAVRNSLGSEFDADGAVLGRRNSRLNAVFVNGNVLQLVTEFHDPTPTVTAVIRHAQRTGRSPERILDECYAALVRLRDLGLIRPVGDRAPGPLCGIGDGLLQWRITSCLQSYEDGDVYTATDPSGESVVCKLGREPSRGTLPCDLRHEAAALRLLDGRGVRVPKLVAFTHDREQRPVLVMSRIPGRRVDQEAQVMRRVATPRLLRVCVRTVDTLGAIHAAGMLHGDVHGGNYLLGPDDCVWAIDFPHASTIGRPSVRHGVPRLMDPQWAQARLSGTGDVPDSPASEQYSMAALLHFLITGEHHYPFANTEQELLEHLAAGTVRADFARNVDPVLRETFTVLERGLRREPEERWPNLASFATAFTEAADKGISRIGRRTSGLHHSHREHFQTYLSPSALSRRPILPTMASGSAGTASALLCASCLTDDPALLAWSVLWADQAVTGDSAGPVAAPESAAREAAAPGRGGAWYGMLGVLGSAVAVSHAIDDRVACAEAARAYLDEHRRQVTPTLPLDLTHGLASCILMNAHVLRALPEDSAAALRELGDRAASRLGQAAVRLPPRPGLAHGSPGWLLALLAWQAATGRPAQDPGLLGDCLQRVSLALRESLEGPEERLGQWCRPGWESSWCNGATGLCLLLLNGAQTLGRAEFLQAAEAAMLVALRGEPHGHDLCCGSAGRLYVLRRLAEATGQDRWRRQGDTEARAVDEWLPRMPDHGFTKGRAGALAALAVTSESSCTFPLVDAPPPTRPGPETIDPALPSAGGGLVDVAPTAQPGSAAAGDDDLPGSVSARSLLMDCQQTRH